MLRIKYFYKPKPQLFFITFAGFFGLLILLLTPPFQIPDEIIHFNKAYQISEGNLISIKQNNRIGGYLPSSLVKITEPFLGLRWNTNAKTNYQIITKQFKIPLNENEKIFIDFPNNALYSPISYIPQSLSIFVLRKFNLPPLFIFYGARLFTLLFWILGIYHAVKVIPFYKWLLVLLALLPMSLFINMSLSADVMTNLLSFLFIAYTLKYTFIGQNFSIKDFIIMAFLIMMLASAKLVYTPLILLILLIPKSKFKSKNQYYLQLIALFVIAIGTFIFWSTILKSLYLPYSLYNKEFRDGASLIECVDAHAQLNYILNHGTYIFRVILNSMIQSFDMYFQGYIGTFGWLDTRLPLWFTILAYMVIFWVALTEKSMLTKLQHKIIVFIALISTIGLILISQHLSWDCVGGEIIFTIQGRYFIPVFPLLFLLFYNIRLNYSKLVIPLVIVFSVISLSLTIYTIHQRYYTIPKTYQANFYPRHKCNLFGSFKLIIKAANQLT